MSCRAAATFCILLIPSVLIADVTLTYKAETKLSPSLPAMVTQTLNASRVMAGPAERKIMVKGGRIYASTAMMDMIADLPNDKLTLLDAPNKHYVTIPISEYAKQMGGGVPNIPAAAQGMLSSLKLTTDSKVTGRTAEIQGIQAEEHEIVLSMGISLGPNAPSSPVMKMVMQLWLAKPEEIARNPALREFVASGLQTIGGVNPTDSIQKMVGQFPGIGDTLGSYMKEIADAHSATLRMHVEVFMPILAMLGGRATAPGAPIGDPGAPTMEMNEELTDISSAPVPDSVFQIPDGYSAVPLADIMSAMVPKPPVAAKPATPASPPATPSANPPATGAAPPR